MGITVKVVFYWLIKIPVFLNDSLRKQLCHWEEMERNVLKLEENLICNCLLHMDFFLPQLCYMSSYNTCYCMFLLDQLSAYLYSLVYHKQPQRSLTWPSDASAVEGKFMTVRLLLLLYSQSNVCQCKVISFMGINASVKRIKGQFSHKIKIRTGEI